MHAFWLHTFCDCFIEATKALTAEDSPAKVQESVKNTIYTCLDTALRFLHPVMPYITEDLWQRLPRRPGCVLETIMLCPFPEEVGSSILSLSAVLKVRTFHRERITAMHKLPQVSISSWSASGPLDHSSLATAAQQVQRPAMKVSILSLRQSSDLRSFDVDPFHSAHRGQRRAHPRNDNRADQHHESNDQGLIRRCHHAKQSTGRLGQ